MESLISRQQLLAGACGLALREAIGGMSVLKALAAQGNDSTIFGYSLARKGLKDRIDAANQMSCVRLLVVGVGESASQIAFDVIGGVDPILTFAEPAVFPVQGEMTNSSSLNRLCHVYGERLSIREWQDLLPNFHLMVLVGNFEDELCALISAVLLQSAKKNDLLTTTFCTHPVKSSVPDYSDSTIICPENEMLTVSITDLISSFARHGFVCIDWSDISGMLRKNRRYRYGYGIGTDARKAISRVKNSDLLKGVSVSAWINAIVAFSCSPSRFCTEMLDVFEAELDVASDYLSYSINDDTLGERVKVSLYIGC